MYFNKIAFVAASLVSTAVALDFGTFDLYCGSSCSGGTLIASGDFDYSSFSVCKDFAEAYEYCYLECCMIFFPFYLVPSTLNTYTYYPDMPLTRIRTQLARVPRRPLISRPSRGVAAPATLPLAIPISNLVIVRRDLSALTS